jgi:ATP-dependent DNA helicase
VTRREHYGRARVSNDRRRLSTSNARATPRRDATRRDGATMAPNGAKRRKASSPIAGEGAAKSAREDDDAGRDAREKMMTTTERDGDDDDGAGGGLVRVNADAEESYDDLTASALTGIEAHAIEAEAELQKARVASPSGKGGGKGASEDASAAASGTTKLDDKKFKQLDALLDQTTIYSQFLSEQMDTLEDEHGKDGDKAKATKKRKKMSESEELEATRKMLPLMEGGSMRDYQLKGVNWMISLYQNGLNGILADQMGLGKTVQTIGFLSHLRSKGVLGPYLVIGPLSTLSNWVSEFQRWTPSIPVLLYHGTRQERAEKRIEFLPTSTPIKPDFPVIVTSYEVVMADRKFLAKYNFKYLVVDEGHRLKNFDCKLIRELKYIPTANKLLLTGTPLQNNLPELWSLLHFLLPDVFSSLSQFQSWFDFADNIGNDESQEQEVVDKNEQEHRARVVSKLHGILRPFLLRRLKGDVELSLPRKKEILLYAQMVPKQKEFNDALVNKTITEMLTKFAGNSHIPVGHTAVNNMLMQLRKNCNHPDLITGGLDGSIMFPSADELVEQCGKMQLLDRLMTRLRARGHKVLIFSQMTRMLDLLESFFQQRGEPVCRIDGSVKQDDRREFIARFNEDPKYGIFLLSTRAGGLGINLTGGDTVIIYDSDWNPHQDLQAMDRVHRIGQTKPVHVYRLATAKSVEGKMLKKAASKLALEKLVVTNGGFKQEKNDDGRAFGADELMALLKGETGANDEDSPQSANISDKDLEIILDRRDLLGEIPPNPPRGIGFEEIEDRSGMSLLGNVSEA